jgi:hypothetical protein
MKITTVNYQKSFVIGPFLQEKIGIEIEIDDTETPESALYLAKQIAEDWHKATNPQLEGMTITDVPVVKNDSDVDTQFGEQLDKEYEAAKVAVSAIEYREDAILWMNNNGWTFNIDFKNIANSKPSKNA